MSDKNIRVTDKRMFTPDGELREEYRESGSAEAEMPSAAGPESDDGAKASPSDAPPAPDTGASPEPASEPSEEGRPRLEIPGTPEELGGPGFIDLVAMVANPAAIFLGDVGGPDGESMEDLDRARWHIDLLDVLKERTTGNVSADELAAMEDLLYQLRLRYLQKKG